MMLLRSCVLVIVFCLLGSPLSAEDQLGVAFWNVENLFDTLDDPDVAGDEEFTPVGSKQWTEERFQQKMDNLAAVVCAMFDGRGPAILGLCEIENRGVVERLVFRLQPLKRNYRIVHQDSPSNRGIDCALIYDADLFELQEARFHHVPPEPTREILEANLVRNGDVLTVFVNHWPARYHPEALRITAATILRTRIDELLTVTPEADILVIGDLNDYPDDLSIHQTLNAHKNRNDLAAGALFNSTANLPADSPKGTYVYDNQWGTLDHVILSQGLLDQKGFSWSPDSTRALLVLESQLYHPQAPGIPRPNRSYSRDRFHRDGYSDHLPVGCLIRKNGMQPAN